MPFPVAQLIEGRSSIVGVTKDDSVFYAFTLMIEHDYSQLPVIDDGGHPLGMVTHESILRGIHNFNTKMENLFVRDVMINAPIFDIEDDLFDLLNRLKETNAVLIVEPGNELVGIVTGYDSTEYFRKRTENLMRIEDIETSIKEFIRLSFTNLEGETNEAGLKDIIEKVCNFDENSKLKDKTFDKLTFSEYMRLLFYKDIWNVLFPVLNIPKESLQKLLNDVRNTRNDLAHFRNEISAEQQNQLRFCVEWITRKQEDWEEKKQKEIITKYLINPNKEIENIPIDLYPSTREEIYPSNSDTTSPSRSSERIKKPSLSLQNEPKESKYAPLADILLSQPGKIDQIKMTFEEIEGIIEGELPSSAYNHRAWWANDSTGHPHAITWLESGWRTSSINMTEKHVTFMRIKEREKLYINFFSSLLLDLSKKTDFPLKNVSPDGASWIVVSNLTSVGQAIAYFMFSFSRDKRFRVELYIDFYDKGKTKLAFDLLKENKQKYESEIGPIDWERIDHKRASRVVKYHQGQIMDNPKKLSELRHWAVETMEKFYNLIAIDFEKVILIVGRYGQE